MKGSKNYLTHCIVSVQRIYITDRTEMSTPYALRKVDNHKRKRSESGSLPGSRLTNPAYRPQSARPNSPRLVHNFSKMAKPQFKSIWPFYGKYTFFGGQYNEAKYKLLKTL